MAAAASRAVFEVTASPLGIGYASVLKAYGERENTRLEHVRELREVLEYQEFAQAEAELQAPFDASRAKLPAGDAWERSKPTVPASLTCPQAPAGGAMPFGGGLSDATPRPPARGRCYSVRFAFFNRSAASE